MFIVNKNLDLIKKVSNVHFNKEFLNLYIDTEYSIKNNLKVLCLGILSNYYENTIVYFNNDLDDNFNPIINYLKSLKIHCELFDFDNFLIDLDDKLSDLEYYDDCENYKKFLKEYKELLKSESFKLFLSEYNLDIKDLSPTKDSLIAINPVNKINVNLIFFFSYADLFKIGGFDFCNWLKSTDYDSHISQYRTLRFMKGTINPKSSCKELFIVINNKVIQLNIFLKEVMYRLPPSKKSLEKQSEIFKLSSSKIDLSKIVNNDNIKNNLDSLLENSEEKFKINNKKMNGKELLAIYNSQDVFLTKELDLKTKDFLNEIRKEFNLKECEISDTTGSNVSQFIKDLIINYYENDISDNVESLKNFLGNKKDISKSFINYLLSFNQIKNLQNNDFNNFGTQGFKTVGGLLFSRVSKNPVIKGKMSDLDLSSCYASAISNDLKIYLGEPVIYSFKNKSESPKLKDVIKSIENKKMSKDTWFLRVTGKLENAINTLIYSDLSFKRLKKEKIKSFYDKKGNLVSEFNLDKIGKDLAKSTLLSKEIKFGLITYDIYECLKLLPENWFNEFNNLSVDFICYYEPSLITDNISDYLKLIDKLPDNVLNENLDLESLLGENKQQLCKKNVSLVFPIYKYWEKLKDKRKELKKENNPLQEVFKLFANSGFGVLACQYLPISNFIASNYITAKARVGCYLMINFLNGFGAITDGTCFKWENIMINKKFKNILSENSNYLLFFNENYKNNLTEDNYTQKWIDSNFKKEIAYFYDLKENDYLINLFNYELKKEKFLSNKGNVETVLFTKFINSNGANYIKAMDNCSLLINGQDYDFELQENYIKARSYQSNNDLINYFTKAFENNYEYPYINKNNKIAKLSDGNIKVISYFNRDKNLETIAHPMGFSYSEVKLMKLITKSQFIFKNELQYKNFLTNQENLSRLSKNILSKEDFKIDKIKTFCEENSLNFYNDCDYFYFFKNNPVGIGFEFLAFNNSFKHNLTLVRTYLTELIESNCEDFNAKLNFSRLIKIKGDKLKEYFLSAIILKANYDYEFKEILINSINSKNCLTINRNEIKNISDYFYTNDSE